MAMYLRQHSAHVSFGHVDGRPVWRSLTPPPPPPRRTCIKLPTEAVGVIRLLGTSLLARHVGAASQPRRRAMLEQETALPQTMNIITPPRLHSALQCARRSDVITR